MLEDVGVVEEDEGFGDMDLDPTIVLLNSLSGSQVNLASACDTDADSNVEVAAVYISTTPTKQLVTACRLNVDFCFDVFFCSDYFFL